MVHRQSHKKKRLLGTFQLLFSNQDEEMSKYHLTRIGMSPFFISGKKIKAICVNCKVLRKTFYYVAVLNRVLLQNLLLSDQPTAIAAEWSLMITKLLVPLES